MAFRRCRILSGCLTKRDGLHVLLLPLKEKFCYSKPSSSKFQEVAILWGIIILSLLRFPVPMVAVTLSWQHWRVETFWSRSLYPIPNKQTQVQRGAATCSRSLYNIGKARSLWSGSLVDAQPTWMKVFWTFPLPSLQSSPDFFSLIQTGCS